MCITAEQQQSVRSEQKNMRNVDEQQSERSQKEVCVCVCWEKVRASPVRSSGGNI